MWNPRKGSAEYDIFMEGHECPINHKGSAAAMEAIGVLNIYQRSVEDLKLRYLHYIGDGDSKAYPGVVQAQPYGPEKIPVKGECIGHIQKRVGSRLRTFKKTFKETLPDGKKIGGAGRLTEKFINKVQNYYGIAIRQNTDSLVKMRKAVGAVLYHSSEAGSLEARHQFCDIDSSWCKYRIAEKLGNQYQDKRGLPAVIRDKIMPIFQALSSAELLGKCLHGKTQNNNEGLNSFIWRRLPKDVYVGRYVLEMGVCSAILHFNSGATKKVDIMKQLGVCAGHFTKEFCLVKNNNRIKNMKRKMSAKGIADRKSKRALRKGFQDKNEEKEGEVYGPGQF